MPLLLGAFGCAEVEKQIEEDSKKEMLNNFKVALVKNLPSPSVSGKLSVFLRGFRVSVVNLLPIQPSLSIQIKT